MVESPTLNVRLPQHLREAIREVASREGKKPSRVVREILEASLASLLGEALPCAVEGRPYGVALYCPRCGERLGGYRISELPPTPRKERCPGCGQLLLIPSKFAGVP